MSENKIRPLKSSPEETPHQADPWSEGMDVIAQVREELKAGQMATAQAPGIPLDLQVEMKASRLFHPARLVQGVIVILALLMVGEMLMLVRGRELPVPALFTNDPVPVESIVEQLGEDLEPTPQPPPPRGVVAPPSDVTFPEPENDTVLPEPPEPTPLAMPE